MQEPAFGGDEGIELLVLVQQAGVLRHGGVALPERGGEDLREPRERLVAGHADRAACARDSEFRTLLDGCVTLSPGSIRFCSHLLVP